METFTIVENNDKINIAATFMPKIYKGDFYMENFTTIIPFLKLLAEFERKHVFWVNNEKRICALKTKYSIRGNLMKKLINYIYTHSHNLPSIIYFLIK